jgi:pilus assembly protein Flp/PilA
MLQALISLIRDEEAATMVEYGIMVALIAAVSIGIVAALGQQVSTAFNNVNSSMASP